MLKFLKSLFCEHEWKDLCMRGEQYQKLCSQRQRYGHCFTIPHMNGTFHCDYYIQRCFKCGEYRGRN